MTAGTRERRQAARLGLLLRPERGLWSAGITHIAGVDEVGVGPLAGPVLAAAVVLPQGSAIRGIDDSKRLSPAVREELAAKIKWVMELGSDESQKLKQDMRQIVVNEHNIHNLARKIISYLDT